MIDNSKEYILCAACYFPDGKQYNHQPRNIDNGFVACGWRHHNCITLADAIIRAIPNDDDFDSFDRRKHLKYRRMEIQGFLTSKGNFVDRKKAANIAFSCGQCNIYDYSESIRRPFKLEGDSGYELKSEDLY